MGTNHYAKSSACEKCGRQDDFGHLGKSSDGWKFAFQYNGGKYYKNVAEMKEWLKDKVIENEYGEVKTYDFFCKMIEKKQREEPRDPIGNYYKEVFIDPERNFHIDGYSFTDCEFC